MRHSITAFLALSLASIFTLGLVSCQKGELETSSVKSTDGQLGDCEITAVFERTKVSYEEVEGATAGNIDLLPSWETGDVVFGLDDNGNDYSFTVCNITEGRATLRGKAPLNGNLHLIHAKGYGATDLYSSEFSSIGDDIVVTGEIFTVSYEGQKGDKSMPAVMVSDGAIKEGAGEFAFSNAAAVIGIDATAGVPAGSVISKVTVNGTDLSEGVVSVSDRTLSLSASQTGEGSITVEGLAVTVTGEDGSLSSAPILIAVPTGASISSICVEVEGEEGSDPDIYAYNLPVAQTLEASTYRYIDGQTFVKASHRLKFTTSKAAHGRVEVVRSRLTEPQPEDGHFEATGQYVTGEVITLTAQPKEGYRFVKWIDSDDTVYTDNPMDFTVPDRDLTIKAFFINTTIEQNGDIVQGGEFTIGPDQDGIRNIVVFSKGNLQVHLDASGKPSPEPGQTSAWRFAATQKEVLGEGGVNTKIGIEAGWMDLFGWSAVGGNAEWGISTSIDDNDYGSEEDYPNNLNDWGKNIYVNGDNTVWRTGTYEEMDYMLISRTMKEGIDTFSANMDFDRLTISLIFYDDDYSGEYNLWSYLSEAPEHCAFLERGGRRQGNIVYGALTYLTTPTYQCWCYQRINKSYNASEKDETIPEYLGRCEGHSVRLISEL